ncbi:ankyrin repeat domain-containing protein 54 isoform X2 [Halyomorpha halys]|uniref:ankyrin repeat domain-containing protein 54 isoform X2 n=1 Tax=Halyomorpha halys TaxID=286706 RepID=UPI0006D5200A|nr:ankyrin repeat domain-containing protein 54-like isoform X2 [Halyomorpha halys]
MSKLEDESSCSLPEDDEVQPENPTSFFHVQPPSLSQGYEICQSPYDSSEITKKIKSTKFRLREYENWLGFKKPLDERRLRQAVSMNDTASVIHLLCKGVSANCCDDLRRSPLHLASCKGYTRIVRILLDHGADPNARDSIGNTPLHLAACTNHIDIIMLLLQAGSDGLSVDKLGRSPLQLAQSKLKILQKSNVTDEEVKQQVSQVIELLLMFAHDGPDTEKLSEARDRVKIAGSREQVDMELRSLLDNLESLSISKPNVSRR